MKRREFVEKSGCGLAAAWLASLGLTSCKKEEAGAPSAVPAAGEPGVAAEAFVVEDKKAVIKKLLIEKMGKTGEEAAAMIAEFEAKLPMVREMCICKGCPSYVAEESEVGFCHPLIGKSAKIVKEKGCVCGTCPVYAQMGMKNGYYCTRMSELEQEAAKA
jgi:hypothetical protein